VGLVAHPLPRVFVAAMADTPHGVMLFGGGTVAGLSGETWLLATDLPAVLTNSSDKTEHIPGKMGAHKVAVHPTPTEFVAAVWNSPLEGTVRIAAKIARPIPRMWNSPVVGWRRSSGCPAA